MMIQNIGNQNNILRPQIQNANMQNLINQLNAGAAKKQNFDVLELSIEAQEFTKESSANKEKDEIINSQSSEMVHSAKWGEHTKAEYAELALSYQRNDLKTMSDQIDYQRSKLEFTTQKIAELENFINGTAAHSDPDMTKETAEIYLHNYKQSITDDYASLTIGRSQHNANELDMLSGGLGSGVFENNLHMLNTQTLGLANLSGDPEQIMKALDNASKILGKITADLEAAFSLATGGKGFEEPAKSFSIFTENSGLDFFAASMEKDYKVVNTISFTGPTLEVDISSIADLQEAKVTQ